MPKLLIEVCVDSVESALAAVRGGADRLEVCGNLGVGGGTTPSMGLFKAIRKSLPQTSLMVMVRPRVGDFVYSPAEFEVMMEDIRNFKVNNAQGVVFGVLTADGNVDVDRTKTLVEEALPLQVCFHRAIDMANKESSAWQEVLSIPGITRVLTSGMAPKATESLEFLKDIFQTSREHAESNTTPKVILPGSGINVSTATVLIKALLPYGLSEIHLSGGQWIDSKMTYRPVGMGMGGTIEWGVWCTDEAAVRSVREIADKLTEVNVQVD